MNALQSSISDLDRFLLWESLHDFWFGRTLYDAQTLQSQLKLWFFRDPGQDQATRDRFGLWLIPAVHGQFRTWENSPRSALSLIILLDQVPRNIFRNQASAFAYDERALEIARKSIKLGFEKRLHVLERMFLYLPFQHSENMEDQRFQHARIRDLLEDAPEEYRPFFTIAVKKAYQHLEAIARFGRFPHRNQILGRTNTQEETEFLKNPEAWF
jgi:uncharacterized protein (DUF924 family)